MRIGMQLLLLLIFLMSVLLVLSIVWQRRTVRHRRLRLVAPEARPAPGGGSMVLALAPLEDWRAHPDRIGEERGRNEQLLTIYESETDVLKWLQEVLLTELGAAGFGVVLVADARADERQPVVGGELLQLLIRPDREELTVSMALRVTSQGRILHRRRYEQIRPLSGPLLTERRWAVLLGEAARDVCAAFADDVAQTLPPDDAESKA
jgi:hypothetical protein